MAAVLCREHLEAPHARHDNYEFVTSRIESQEHHCDTVGNGMVWETVSTHCRSVEVCCGCEVWLGMSLQLCRAEQARRGDPVLPSGPRRLGRRGHRGPDSRAAAPSSLPPSRRHSPVLCCSRGGRAATLRWGRRAISRRRGAQCLWVPMRRQLRGRERGCARVEYRRRASAEKCCAGSEYIRWEERSWMDVL